jgi:16S rRNA (adenine1518-N6/adenine1519-N6)-dimethyltransferase
MGRRLGQHFLYDREVIGRIVRSAAPGPDDTVVEIGPGPGALTAALLQRAGRVVAIELDRALAARLRERFASAPNLTLVEGDALRFDYGGVGPFSVVANIPYEITTPLIFRLLEFRGLLGRMTLTVQKEVAERLAAPPGGKSYGVLSIAVQSVAEVSVLFPVPRALFHPPPRVDSACVGIVPRETPLVRAEDEALFFRIVRTAFSKRRKTLNNALAGVVGPDEIAAVGINGSRRPETLSIEEFARLLGSSGA